MRIGGPMEVTREFFAPINIKIDRITEYNALVDALESAVEDHEKESKERDTLISMCNILSEISL
jgi:hypothetical protein